MERTSLGVDVGGSGIKGAVVDLTTGDFVGDRCKLATPKPATPDAVAATVAEVAGQLGWSGPLGCTFPGVVAGGIARSAANVDPTWVGTDVAAAVASAHGSEVTAVNDADAAGLAEVHFGAARHTSGVVLVVTLGTGIGTALIHEGRLVPNCELGHLELDGVDYETRASAAAREREGLSWPRWAARLQRYFRAVEDYLWPDLIVVGGGVSRRAHKFLPLLELRTPIVPAGLENRAGIVGAALLAPNAPTLGPVS
jgi:polyphosphate glucokinase